MRMLGSSVLISVTLVVFTHATAEAHVNLTSSITVFPQDLIAPWINTFGRTGGRVQAMLSAKIQH